MLGTDDRGVEVRTSSPGHVPERLETLGDTFPESLEEGRETDVGPSLSVDLRLEDCREEAEPPDERERDRGGRIAGGGSGGGTLGIIGSCLSPPGSWSSTTLGGQETDFLLPCVPREDRLRSD